MPKSLIFWAHADTAKSKWEYYLAVVFRFIIALLSYCYYYSNHTFFILA